MLRVINKRFRDSKKVMVRYFKRYWDYHIDQIPKTNYDTLNEEEEYIYNSCYLFYSHDTDKDKKIYSKILEEIETEIHAFNLSLFENPWNILKNETIIKDIAKDDFMNSPIVKLLCK